MCEEFLATPNGLVCIAVRKRTAIAVLAPSSRGQAVCPRHTALNGSSPLFETAKNQIPGWVSGFLVARQGLEPWTHALKGRCSTN